ncbi:MAG TPA: cation:proton antiporter [Thermoclostridium caenicola]|uniref:cation:proton antiporter n=1 Tax=Thermoclostridium caenicola TaxID=659425 RepID=UPI002CDB082D|nr:cation:proton antiporter [Thermoclostridium caenicola]HOK42164.1 cation:proton antiporter [Thermoclostridium caenicola]HOL84247.1 cation:proton antiporter [Thermoclostridium caenicola]HOP72255.1 cation:proton antiporter [Thermoclostridium caenicola]HPO75675.1 cation:proton antiporter [Thermoclostridium caenicola]
MSPLFYAGLMLFCGLLMGRLAKLVGLPNVTGYIVGGLIIGPYVLGIVSSGMAEGLNIISEMALGFIALSIGAEFELSYFREVGKAPVIIAVLEGLFAIAFVTAGLLIMGFELPLTVILGAIASATAPAATIMVIRQYQANGPVTKTLLSVVALDDAVALIAFGFAVAITKSLTNADGDLLMGILDPFITLLLSIVIGVVSALILLIPMRFFKKTSNRTCAVVGIVFLTLTLADYFGASSLLACMVLGAVFTNISQDAASVFRIADNLTPPIFMLFFVLSGARLDVTLIPAIGVIGVGYILLRVLGKLSGAWLGAVISKAPKTVRKYLGWALVPQAGVAIGLTLVADQVVPEYAPRIRTVILCATLIYELIGPVISKMALKKAGEIQESTTAPASDAHAG